MNATNASLNRCRSAIITAMLSDGISLANSAAQAAAFRSMSGVQGVLDPQKRQQMVEQINKAIDMPLLSEDQEAAVIDKCLCTISAALFRILPPAWLSVLQGSSSVEIRQLEELAVSRAEALVPDVPVSLAISCVAASIVRSKSESALL